MITHAQLLDLDYSPAAIEHYVNTKRLFRIHDGVFVVGRPDLSRNGRWMAGVLACGEGARLGYGSAAALRGVGRERGELEVCVPFDRNPDHPGIRVHRRRKIGDLHVVDRIPVMGPVDVMVDLASYLDRDSLEAAINAADRKNVIDPDALRAALARDMRGRAGAGLLRKTLDRRTFTYTDSALERAYLPLSDAAGLPRPRTQLRMGWRRVDFRYPNGLLVEADGLRYHRTAAQQNWDLERDQDHFVAGFTTLRFSHSQIRYEPERVVRVLSATAARLQVAA